MSSTTTSARICGRPHARKAPFPAGVTFKSSHGQACKSPHPESPSLPVESDCATSGGSQVEDGGTYVLTQQHPNDTLIIFPQSSQTLWASSRILRTKSPYFEQLLNSGFEESMQVEHAHEESNPGKDDDRAQKLTRLDDNEIAQSSKEGTSNKVGDRVIKCEQKVFKVTMTEGSYETYKIIFWWMYTSKIIFTSTTNSAPSPSFDPLNLDNHTSSSPQAIYQVSEYLQIRLLSSLALDAIKKRLTTMNVAEQGFGKLCQLHPDLRAVAVKFMAEHYEKTEKSEGMKRVRERMQEEALPSGGSVMDEIFTEYLKLKK